MKNSYIPKPKPPRADRRGRPVNPEKWVTGPDPHRREKYYAFLKHKAQCNFRNELYELTFDDWETYWTDENYSQRGRRKNSLVLTRKDITEAWSVDNCILQTREVHLKRKKEFLKS